MIVTVQRVTENPREVAKYCRAHGIRHKHINLDGANRPLLENKVTQAYLKKEINALFKHMTQNKEVVLVHCAAGIHRTGTVGYSLLRLSGLQPAEAYEGLRHIRPDTHKGVGDWRIELAEKFIVN